MERFRWRRGPGAGPCAEGTRFTWGVDLSPLGPLHVQNRGLQLELIEVGIVGKSPAELVELAFCMQIIKKILNKDTVYSLF